MNILINAPIAVHDDLLATVMAKIQLDGHQVEINNFGDTCFLIINPAAQEPEPEPEPEQVVVVSSDIDQIDNQTLAPEQLPDATVEVPTEEPIAVDIPVDMSVTPTPEPLPDITILSLTSQSAVRAVRDTSTEFSKLEVSGVNTPNGLVNFWYCGIEFNMPKAVEVDRSTVLNPSHLVGPTTIRVVIRAPNGSVMPLLIDIVGVGEIAGETAGKPELLVCGNDVVI